MQQLYMTTYRLREGLGADDLRTLTRQLAEAGSAPGVIAHYVRLDGTGGYIVRAGQQDPGASDEATFPDQPSIDAVVIAVTTFEEAFPVIEHHERRAEELVSWTGRERLRLLWYRLRLGFSDDKYAFRRAMELQLGLPPKPYRPPRGC